MDTAKEDRFIRLDEVCRLTSLKKSTVNLWVAKGRFPAPKALAATIKVWRLSDIHRWMDGVSNDSWKPLPDEENPPENVRTLLCQVSK